MPRDPLEGINITEAGIGPSTVDHQYPPSEVTTKVPQEASSFVDGSCPIFSMYSERATEDDEKMVESWKADAEGILIFTGLFSAAVASLISVSIGHSTELTGHLQLLPLKYLSDSRQPWIQPFEFPSCFPSSIFSPGEVRGIIKISEPEPSLFSRCKVAGHHPDSTPHIHDDSASAALTLTAPHGNAAPTFPIPATHRVEESFTDMLPLDKDTYAPGSFHPAHYAAVENVRVPSTPQYQVTIRVIQDGVDTPAVMIHLLAQEPSASTHPVTSKASTSPPGAVAIPHAAHRHTPLADPDIPSSPTPAPVLGPTEPHLSMPTPATSFISPPRLTSVPDLGAATEDEGSPNAALHNGRGALEPPAIQENSMASRDLPPLSSVTDVTVAIAGPSWHEHTGHHPPYPSNEYDIV